MLKLSIDRDPFWVDILPGVRIRFRPVSVAAILAARSAAAEVLRSGGDNAEVKAGLAFTASLARSGIVEWEGVGDADGAPLDATSENVDAALECWPAFDAIDRLYVSPAIVRTEEKNA